MEAKINEIFTSIQGEGTIVGYKQLFIRFCNCNLNCAYCDTEFKEGKFYTPKDLYTKISSRLSSVHSVSLTGGEPLLDTNFLLEFLPLINKQTKIYLETNATLAGEFVKIKSLTDIVAADIKLPSATGKDTFTLHDKFLEECKGIETFAKIVFDEKITDEEIEICSKLGKKHNIELVLQPKMTNDILSVNSEFCNEILDKFLTIYHNVRLIPQVHKFLKVK